MVVYPSNMACTAVKLCENAFQLIPDVSFLNGIFFWTKKIRLRKQFLVDFVGFWRSNSETDLAIIIYVKFCSRTTDDVTDPEVCTTEND